MRENTRGTVDAIRGGGVLTETGAEIIKEIRNKGR